MTKILLLAIALFLYGCGGGGNNTSGSSSNSSSSGGSSGNSTDTIPPNITLKGSPIIRLLVGDTFLDPGTTATDNQDGDITSKVQTTSTVNTSTPGNYTVTYTVSDSAGNKTEISREVRVFFKNKTNIYINEFLANNNTNKMDSDFYAFSDWIELYNNSNQNVNISGYGLSDDQTKTPWKIPSDTIIPAHRYIIFWADKKNTGLHTNFSLGRKGEEVILYDASGKIIDRIKYTKQKADISYGRDNSGLWEYMEPTYQAKNKTGVLTTKRSSLPQFSIKGGFYNSPQTITISTEDGGEIHYTTDGSFPTKNSPKYSHPLSFSETTTLRAVGYKDGLIKSKDQTMTYFINWDTSLPVVSLSTDPKYFFDDTVGIYVTGTNGRPLLECRNTETEKHNYAQDWQRPVHIEYYNEQKNEDFSFNLDIAITGQCSRHNPKKSFSLELGGKYGTKTLKYKLYDSKDITKFKDFRLRTGDKGYKIRDLISVALVTNGNLNIDYQAYRTVQLFLNGSYWGIYNIREKKGLEYLKSNYPDINTSNVDLISIKVKAGDKTAYNNLDNYVKTHDLSINENYQEVLNKVDEDSFIDYMILEIFSGNTDWPFNNFRAWREKKPGAKWRWILEDLDYGFVNTNVDRDNFAIATTPGVLKTDLFIALLKNPTFKTKFKNRFYELLNTLFTPSNLHSLIDKIVQERIDYMDMEPAAWGITLSRFNNDLVKIRDFADRRRNIVKRQLDNF